MRATPLTAFGMFVVFLAAWLLMLAMGSVGWAIGMDEDSQLAFLVALGIAAVPVIGFAIGALVEARRE